MKTLKLLKTLVTVLLCATMGLPHAAFGEQNAVKAINGINISPTIKNLVLDGENALQGMIVDNNGRPVEGAEVVIGQRGKMVASARTNDKGRYRCVGMQPGIYQVASFAGLQTYQVWQKNNAPADSVTGSLQVMDGKAIQRAQDRGGSRVRTELCSLLKNPCVWGIVIAAAIALPLLLDDDDAS